MNKKITIIAVSFIIIINSLIFVFASNKSKTPHRIDEKVLTVIAGQLSEGEVLGNILAKQGVELLDVSLITNTLNKIFNLRKCNVGDKWKLYLDSKGNFNKFEYYDGPMEFYVVEPDINNNTFIASTHEIKAKKIIRGTRGKIKNSLYQSMTSLNVHPEMVVQFAEIFASTIDFFTDCRPDDEFSILWDSYVDKDGVVLKDINILAASYTRSGYTHNAFYYKTPDGNGNYYDENGDSVEAVFLKAPLNYRRISSYFTRKRYHPILKKYRPHLGIDYAAPRGTPISAIGDGVITAAGRRRDGLGTTIIIKHPNNHKSWYGHLSKIAKGVLRGSRVKKGQVIGYVGATGLATGPHLDFRLQNGKTFVNFLALKMPPSHPLPEKYQKNFEVAKNMLMETTDNLKPGEITFFQNKKARKLYSLY
ncbi:MAG: M23 family metallopeptidase [Proteobacteria bacterium]|nr:M23 family metallopeptidase [Pseudomonadota bacterium]